jgi:GTPase
MDIWSDDDLNQMERRADYALGTEDDGRVLLIPPQTIKDLITEFRRLRTEMTAPDDRPPR